MAISKKQAEFDVEKWLKSESVGHDLCGDFEFCVKCDKSLENPCAVAYDAFAAPAPKKKTAKPAAKKGQPRPGGVSLTASELTLPRSNSDGTNKESVAAPVKKSTAQKASVKITEKEQTRTTRNKTASKKSK